MRSLGKLVGRFQEEDKDDNEKDLAAVFRVNDKGKDALLSKGGIANAPSVKVRYSVTNDDAFSPVSYVVVDRAYHTIMCRALLDLRPSDCKESEPRLGSRWHKTV